MHPRSNRRTNGARLLYIADLKELAERHLPETAAVEREGDQWGLARLRPEVATVIDALTARHADATGRKLSKSEVLACALNLSLPVMAARMFPARDAR